MRWRAWIWVFAMAALTAACIRQFTSGHRVETDLLAMLPPTERNSVAEEATVHLGRLMGSRGIFLVSSEDGNRSKAAAIQFARALEASGAFHDTHAVLPMIDVGEVVRFYAPYRFRLLVQGDHVEADAQSIRTQLATRLMSPISGLPGAGLDIDPFGHLENFVASLPFHGLGLEQEDGFLVARDRDGIHVLVTGDLSGSAYDPNIQKKTLAAVGDAEKSLRRSFPDVRLLRTGAVFFAGESRASAEREMNRIGWGSLIGVALLLLVVFRSSRHLLLGQICIGAGILTGTVATIALFGKLHLLTLVCGSSLIGVAEDYPLQFFARHLAAGKDWEPLQRLRRISIGLLLGFLTTVLGYASLLITPFPGLLQIAVFSVSGLTASFLTVFLLFPAMMTRPMSASAFPLRWSQRLLSPWRSPRVRSMAPWLLIGLAALAIPALLRLEFSDDIRELVTPLPSLLKEEAQIRKIVGLSNSSQFFLVQGKDEGQVLEREETLRQRIAPLLVRGDLAFVHAVSSFVPSPSRQAEALKGFSSVSSDLLPRALREAGFREEVLNRLRKDFVSAQQRPLTVASWMSTSFSIPFRYLWIGSTGRGYASIVLPLGFPSTILLERAAHDLEGITLVDKVQSVSQVFSRYRFRAALALSGAFLLVFLILLSRYGFRDSGILLVPVAFGILFALAAVSWMGNPVTLFNVMALILVLGIGVDYSIFLREGGEEETPAFLGVLLAAAATLLSFGFLSFSTMPALRSFGITLVVGVFISLVLAPLVVTFRREKNR